MAIDISTFEKAVHRKKGLMDKLGDVGRFLKAFLQGGELSETAIKKTINDLEQYSSVCLDQMEDIGREGGKGYRQIIEHKKEMAISSPPIKSTMMSQAGIMLHKYDMFQGRLNKLKRNGVAAQVLIEKLYDVLILQTGPMTEDNIDEWTTTLEETIEKRAMEDKALKEFSKTDESKRFFEAEVSVEDAETKVNRIESGQIKSESDQITEKRLEEEF